MARDMPTGKARAKAILRSMGDFFWPPRSLIASGWGVGSGPLSPEDFAKLRFISDPLCDRCGVPRDFRTGYETCCVVCLARPPRWDRARAALLYDEIPAGPCWTSNVPGDAADWRRFAAGCGRRAAG